MSGNHRAGCVETAHGTIVPLRTRGSYVAISLEWVAPLDDAEIAELSRRNPGLQIERAATGELIVTPTGGDAGRREAELVAQLHRWAAQDGRGIVFGPSTGFHLPDGSLFSPDASWVRRERWTALTGPQREGFVPLCPDAVFEIASHTDVTSDIRGKMRAYIANGARLAALIDPRRRTVEISSADGESRASEPARWIPLDPVLPRFSLDLEPIFE